MSLTLRTEADVSQLIKDLRSHGDATSDLQVVQDLPDHLFQVADTNGLTISRSELMLVVAERIKAIEMRLANKDIEIKYATAATTAPAYHSIESLGRVI